ncbi:MAG: hypothetical protein AAFX50_21880 [Acidobacteriota bacterium]
MVVAIDADREAVSMIKPYLLALAVPGISAVAAAVAQGTAMPEWAKESAFLAMLVGLAVWVGTRLIRTVEASLARIATQLADIQTEVALAAAQGRQRSGATRSLLLHSIEQVDRAYGAHLSEFDDDERRRVVSDYFAERTRVIQLLRLSLEAEQETEG